MARDYKEEYRKFQSSPHQKKARANRNHNRRLAIRKYGKAKLRGKDIDHKDGNPMNNSPRNLQIMSASKNRAKH